MFWDAVGSHLDFTNGATAAWWRQKVTSQLLDMGIRCTWNDNNEWHVEDESALCHGFGTPTPLKLPQLLMLSLVGLTVLGWALFSVVPPLKGNHTQALTHD